MKLRRNRRRTIWLGLGAALTLISVGLVRAESKAEPLGKTLFQKHSGVANDDPQPGGKLTTPLAWRRRPVHNWPRRCSPNQRLARTRDFRSGFRAPGR